VDMGGDPRLGGPLLAAQGPQRRAPLAKRLSVKPEESLASKKRSTPSKAEIRFERPKNDQTHLRTFKQGGKPIGLKERDKVTPQMFAKEGKDQILRKTHKIARHIRGTEGRNYGEWGKKKHGRRQREGGE